MAPSRALDADIVVRSPLVLYVSLALFGAAVFVADLYTPLGMSVWVLYLVPLFLTLRATDARVPVLFSGIVTILLLITLFTDERVGNPMFGYVNRACGFASIWTIALLMRNVLIARHVSDRESRLRGVHTSLLRRLQGELSMEELGGRVLEVLGVELHAPAATLYATDDQHRYRLVAAQGVDREGLPTDFLAGDGLLGGVAASGRVAVLDDVPASSFRISTSLTSGPPRCVAVAPLVHDERVHGVVELGLTRQPDARLHDLLDRLGGSIAVAIRTASYRHRVRVLLEQTQQQRNELQAQQEELRVANEELEEQSRALKESQARLEEQQAELEATNAQLESQTQELEMQQQALAESAARAEQASQYKSEFLANMSHELRTPLNSVLILAKLLADDKGGRLSADQVRYATTIHASGTHLLTLINDILDLARIEAGRVDLRPEPVEVARMVDGLRESFEPIARERGLAFSASVAADVPATIHADPVRLQQVLVNLLSNACKFTDAGHVRLLVSRDEGDRIAWQVEDTGPGIPSDKFEVIFEAFRQADGSTQRRYGGTGLGLSISRELAALLGGELRLESRPGEGSRFTLVMPVRHEAAAATGERPPAIPRSPRPTGGSAVGPGAATPGLPQPAAVTGPAATPRHGRLLLVVEDDLAFAGILVDLAHDLEFDCATATTTDEGMRLALELQPTGILLDVELPDGSGLTLLDRLKRNAATRHIPVHMISVSDHTQTALALGAVGYAIKPTDRETLVESIRRIEAQTQRRLRRVLIVEDDPTLRASIIALLQLDGVEFDDVGTARDALARLQTSTYDCVVLDLVLPDASGFDVLEAMSRGQHQAFPPVIIYTGRALSAEEEDRLRRYSRSVILKGARSPERLLDEVTLFLHRVESTLPTDSQRLLRVARERDEFFAGRRILLAEDDVRSIFALSAVLEPRGATLVIARNGREAVDLAQAQHPDLVLMDIMMPEMDGLAAIRALRAQPAFRTLPIIALTAKARRDDYEQCLAAGASDYMAKPLDVDKLVSLCRVWMAR